MTTFRSKFEEKFSKNLIANGIPVRYEEEVVKYTIPAIVHKYHPDWCIGNYWVETKGIWSASDRQKILYVMEQHPEKKIIMVFYRWSDTIGRTSKTTYKMFCEKHGIECYNQEIPASRLAELLRS